MQAARISSTFVFHFDNEMRLHAPNVRCTRLQEETLLSVETASDAAAEERTCQGVTTGGLVP